MASSESNATPMMPHHRRRILALWFPQFSTDRLQRRWKALEDFRQAPDRASALPLVVAAKTGNALQLIAVDRKAKALGLRIGMPLADARAMLPSLKVIAANELADRKLLERLADWCGQYTPFVAFDGQHALLLDVTGVPHLFKGERALLDHICAGLTRQGFTVLAALAGSPAAARALARFSKGTIVPPGEDAKALASLPIEALCLDAAITRAFRRAGIKTIAQVADRKRSELTARFGKDTVMALDAALGYDKSPISPRLPVPDYTAEHRFAEPIVTEDAVLKTLSALTEALAGTLAKHGEGARRMEAVFFRTDGTVYRIAVETGVPTRDTRVIERLFRERLDRLSDPLDPGFGYDLIRLEANRVERVETRSITFESNANEEKELSFLIDRLAARFGSHRIRSFQPNDTHIPEVEGVAVPAQYADTPKRPWQIREAQQPPRRPLRMFAKPEPVDVFVNTPHGPPAKFRWRQVLHGVAHVDGPERIAMEWWRHQSPQLTRDYFRLEDEEGRRYWLYRDGVFTRDGSLTSSPRWYIHGVFA